MADRLKAEEQRLRAAIRSGATEDAKAICRRILALLAAAARELSTPRRRPPIDDDDGGRADAATAPGAWLRHTLIAKELDIDPRTLWGAVDGRPFARQMSDRVKLIHRARFYAALEQGTLHLEPTP